MRFIGNREHSLRKILRRRPARSFILAGAILFLVTACGEQIAGPSPSPSAQPLTGAVTSSEADLEDRFTGAFSVRYPDAVCTLDDGPVVIDGSVDIHRMDTGWAAMIGLIDKGLYESQTADVDSWGSGAYAYFGHIGSNLRIGPSDGFGPGGELNQVGTNVAGVFSALPHTVDFTLTVDPGTQKVTVRYDGIDYTDDYGETEDAGVADAYPGTEFESGAIIGVDIFDTPTDVTYRLDFVSGCSIAAAEPTDRSQCKKGGWQDLARADESTFKNQGDCIQYVNTGK